VPLLELPALQASLEIKCADSGISICCSAQANHSWTAADRCAVNTGGVAGDAGIVQLFLFRYVDDLFLTHRTFDDGPSRYDDVALEWPVVFLFSSSSRSVRNTQENILTLQPVLVTVIIAGWPI
jgi:hypothetical protein